jgi:outer membrane protein assembly factor BamB
MRKLSQTGTLYFFPAFLPLADLVPWLLTVIGAVAGIAGFSAPALWRKYRRVILAAAVFCLAGAAGTYVYYMPAREVRMDGTRLILPEKFYVPVMHGQAAPLQLPARRSFGEIWSKRVDKQILATPVIAGDLLIYGGYDNLVEAHALQDGAPVWSLPEAAPIFAVARDTDGVIYASEGIHDTTSAALTAINAGTGKIIWRREFLGHLEETPAFDPKNHREWISAGPGGLWAVDDRKGDVLWHQPLGHIDAQPLALGGVIFVPAQPDEKTNETMFFALDAAAGKVLWRLPMPGQPWGGPAIDKTGKIILTTTGIGQIGVEKSTDRGWAEAASPDGKLLWQVELASMPLQPGAYIPEDDLIVYALKNGGIVALHVADGSQAWQAKAGGELQAAVTPITGLGRSMIAATSYDGVFTIRDAATGVELARRTVGKSATSSPVVGGDVIYVTSAYEIDAFAGLREIAEGK